MTDDDILASICAMVEKEHALRGQVESHQGSGPQSRAELDELQESLDQCWDLLRQRRAKAELHQDPAEAELRPTRVGGVPGLSRTSPRGQGSRRFAAPRVGG